MYKPSTLWPPPSEESTSELRKRFKSRVKAAVLDTKVQSKHLDPPSLSVGDASSPDVDSHGHTATTRGDTILDSLAAPHSSHEASKKLTPTLSHLQDESPSSDPSKAKDNDAAPPPSSSEDTRTAKTSGYLPLKRGEPIRLEIDGQYAEIHSQVQLYTM